MVKSREYRAVVASRVGQHFRFRRNGSVRHLGRDHGVVTVIRVKGLRSSPATKGEADCSLENERHAHRCSRHPLCSTASDCRPLSHRDTFYYFGTDETWLIEEDEGRAKSYRFSEERRRRRRRRPQLRRGESPN